MSSRIDESPIFCSFKCVFARAFRRLLQSTHNQRKAPVNTLYDPSRRTALTVSNEYMKVTLAKLKADQEKSGKKVEHKVGLGSKSFFSLSTTCSRSRSRLTRQENFKTVAQMWAKA